jgi:hypothetical protein
VTKTVILDRFTGPRTLVKDSSIKRREVQRNFIDLGFSSHYFGVNIYRVNRLRMEQYQSFLKLLDKIKSHIADRKYVVDELIPLELPPVDQLRAIDFTALLSRPGALTEVLNRCVMPEGKYLVDLSILPTIYREYIV